MKSRLVGVLALAASGWLAAAVATPGGVVLAPVPETEPNNTSATATALSLVGGCQVASGAISPGSDLDYYSFTAAPGSKVLGDNGHRSFDDRAGLDPDPLRSGRDNRSRDRRRRRPR